MWSETSPKHAQCHLADSRRQKTNCVDCPKDVAANQKWCAGGHTHLRDDTAKNVLDPGPQYRLTSASCTKNAIMCMICGFPFGPRGSVCGALSAKVWTAKESGVSWVREDTQTADLDHHHQCVNFNSPRRRFIVNNAFEIRSQSLKCTDSLKRYVGNDDRDEDRIHLNWHGKAPLVIALLLILVRSLIIRPLIRILWRNFFTSI